MDASRFTTIDTFPIYPKHNRLLLYYMIKSTRVSIAAFGSRFVLLYVKNKLSKRYTLPEDVTCGVIINIPPTSCDSRTSGKILLCGTDCGSIFAINLPSSKQDVTDLKDQSKSEGELFRSNHNNHILVYKHEALEICDISCVNCHLLIVGRDESSGLKLFLFQENVLSSALVLFQGEAGLEGLEKSTSCIYDTTSVNVPSVSNPQHLNMIIFQGDQSRAGPYYNALNNVFSIDQGLFDSLFQTSTPGPVACFFSDNGEVWFRTLSNVSSSSDLEFLCHVQEECVSCVPVLTQSSFEQTYHGQEGENGGTGLKPALAIFGDAQNICILSERSGKAGEGKNFQQTFIPYSTELKAQVENWNYLVHLHEAYIRRHAQGLNITHSPTTFLGEQRIGSGKPEQIWTFQDYESHTALLSVNFNLFATYSEDESANSGCRIQELITELQSTEEQCKEMKESSSRLSAMLRSMQAMSTYVIDNPLKMVEDCHIRDVELLRFSISHGTVVCEGVKRLNIMVNVLNNDENGILSPFSYVLDAVVRQKESARSQIHTLDVKNLGLKKDIDFCITIGLAELELCGGTDMKISLFLKISELKEMDCKTEKYEILTSGFPILFKLFSKTFNYAVQ